MDEIKPSERFCKHGFLLNEKYNPNIHNGRNLEERCGRFYTPEEITRMKSEITVASCNICFEELTETDDCMCCSDGHKFHIKCIREYWIRNPDRNFFCPTTNTLNRNWDICNDINDIHSGGKKKSKKSKKKRKTRKSNKKRKTRKSNKKRKPRKSNKKK